MEVGACILGFGFYQALAWYQLLCGAVLALCSVVLYEWTRRTVIDRNFYTALGGEVPAAVCRSGPYKFVRHPFHLSYVIAFLGVVAAFASLAAGCVCLLNIGLFLYMAFDERVTCGDYKPPFSTSSASISRCNRSAVNLLKMAVATQTKENIQRYVLPYDLKAPINRCWRATSKLIVLSH